jgi:superfamily I DNA/RNA helicase
VVKNVDSSEDLAEDNTFPTIKPNTALRRGPRPILHLAGTKTRAVESTIEQIRGLVESGYSSSDIAILYRYKSKRDDALFRSLLEGLGNQGLPVYWVTESQETKVNYSARKPGIRVITTLSSLGLEFKVVLLLWVEQFADCFDQDSEKKALARRQLYVAMTRAQEELHLIAGDTGSVVNALGKAEAIDVAGIKEPAQTT